MVLNSDSNPPDDPQAQRPSEEAAVEMVQNQVLSVGVLRFPLQPDDRVIIRVPNKASMESLKTISNACAKMFKGHQYVITTFDLELTLVRDGHGLSEVYQLFERGN